MKTRTILITAGVAFACLVIAMIALSADTEAATWTVDHQGNGDFLTIQEAVDAAANHSDTIRVYDGVYNENVLVNRSMTLIGNGSARTMIDAGGEDDALKITGDHVNVSGFSLTNSELTGTGSGIRVQGDNVNVTNCSSHHNRYGIYLKTTNYVRIEHCEVSENEVGIQFFFSSRYNTIRKTTSSNNEWGMILHQDCDSNTIVDNTFSGNTNGIRLWGSRYNTIAGNTFTGESIDFRPLNAIEGLSFVWMVQNITDTNTINGDPVAYLINETGVSVPAGSGQIIIVNSTDITVEGQNPSNGTIGICVGYSSRVAIANSTIKENEIHGVRIIKSDNCTLINTTLSMNGIGLSVELDSLDTMLSECRVHSNLVRGIDASVNEGEEVNATGTWWGHVSGPYIPGTRDEGKGEEITSDVVFDPWTDEPPLDEYEDPEPTIVSIVPDRSDEGEEIILTGKGTAYDSIDSYIWTSDIDGEFYNGSEEQITPFSFKEGFESRSVLYPTGGDARWGMVNTQSKEGGRSARSGVIGKNDESWMEFSLMGPGTLNLFWKVSSESGFDALRLSVDGEDKEKISGEVDWTRISVNVTKGAHTIRLSYSKDGSNSDGADAGWIDDIEYRSNALLSNGTHVIELYVVDSYGVISGSVSSGLSINGRPIATIDSISPDTALDIDTIEFKGSGTDDGEIVRYVWTSSIDGEFYNGTDEEFTNSTLSNGTHTITFKILDDNGTWSKAVTGVLEINGKPRAWMEDIQPNPALDVDTVTFSGNASDDGSIARFVWTSSIDGEFSNGSMNSFDYGDLSNGTHTISFRVQDNNGTWSDTVTETLVINGKPVASIGTISPNPALDVDSVTFRGSASDEGSIDLYVWSSDIDGEFHNGTSHDLSYGNLSNGTHVISFRAQDNNGTWSDTVTAVLVINGKPVASIDLITPDPGLDIETITFNGSVTDDGSVVRYSWRSDIDGEFYNDTMPGLEYGDLSNGTHTIFFRGQDNNGTWSDEDSMVLTINGKPVAEIASVDPNPALDVYDITFNGSGSDDGELVLFVWWSDIDGEFYNGTDREFNIGTLSNGTHTIIYKVQDNNGTWSDEVSMEVIINGRPVARIVMMDPNPALDVESITLEGNGTDDSAVVRYLWRSSLDGTIYDGPNTSFTLQPATLTNGTHIISLEVQDDDGAWSEQQRANLEVNGKPVGAIGAIGPNPGLDIDMYTFNGSGTDDGSITRYRWSSSLDGEFYNGTNESFEMPPPALSNGTHSISFSVMDNNGTWSDTVEMELVINGKPVASIDSISPSPALDIDTVTFNGSGTDDGTIARYLWTSSLDGIIHNDTVASFTLPPATLTNGTHEIELIVLDNDGTWSDVANATLKINGKPIGWIESIDPDPAVDDSVVTFIGNGSDDGTITRYQWNSSLDGVIYDGTEGSFTSDMLSNGTHTIVLRAQDNDGTWSDEVSLDISINGRPVSAIDSILPDPALNTDMIEFIGSGSDDGNVVRYVWTSSIDGELQNDTVAGFQSGNLSNGTHMITFRVLDDIGIWSNESFMVIRVLGIPVPTIRSMSPSPALHDETINFSADVVDDGSIERYVWRSVLDDIEFYNGTESSFLFQGLSNGTHDIVLRVLDDQGLWSEEISQQIVVNGRPVALITSITPNPTPSEVLTNFTGEGTDDGAVSIFAWYSDIDGELYNGTGKSFETDQLSTGNHTIQLFVKDDEGAWSHADTSPLRVHRPPVANIDTVTPGSADWGVLILFEGNGTDDGSVVRFQWESDLDGTLYDGQESSFESDELSNGTHMVTLRVQDNDGEWSDPAFYWLRIFGRPVSWIEEIQPGIAQEGEAVHLTGAGTDDGTIVLYVWTSSRDGEIYNGTFPEFDIENLTIGLHTIYFQVVDDHDLYSHPEVGSVRVYAEPAATIESILPALTIVGEGITFTANATDADNITAYQWRSSLDGIFSNESVGTLLFSGLTSGTHTIYLRVQNKYGAWSQEVFETITVLRTPTAMIDDITPDPVKEGESLTLKGHAETDDAIVSYHWRSNIDGPLYAGPEQTVLLTDLSIGQHTVYFKVLTENDFWSDEAEGQVEVVVPNVRPDVNVSEPESGSVVKGTITVSGSTDDEENNVQKVEFSIDAGDWQEANGTVNWTFEVNTKELINGAHFIRIRAYDGIEYSLEAEFIITVENKDDDEDGEGGFLMAVLLLIVILLLVVAISLYLFKSGDSGKGDGSGKNDGSGAEEGNDKKGASGTSTGTAGSENPPARAGDAEKIEIAGQKMDAGIKKD